MNTKPHDETEATSEEEKLPLEISERYFAEFREKSASVLKALQERGEGEFSLDFNRLLTLCDRLNLNLRGEQKKVQHMTENHIDATKRVEEAVKISQRDRDTIGKLREEIVEAWSLMENSKMKEIQALEKLEEMRERIKEQQQDILKLSSKVDTSDLSQMGKHQKTVLQEIERLTAEIDDINHRLSMQRIYADEIQIKLDESQEKNRDLFYQWDQATNESISNKKRLDTMKKNVEQLEESNYDLTQNLTHYQSQSESRLRTLKERERQSGLIKDELEKTKTSNIALLAAKGRTELNLKAINSELSNMKHLVDQTKNFMRLKEDENKKLVIENERNLKKIEAQIRKIAEISLTTSRKENEIQTLKSEITSAEKERDSIKRANDLMKKEKENLQKKAESLIKETEKRDEIISTLKTERSALEERKLLTENELKQSEIREKTSKQTITKLLAKVESLDSEKLFMEESIKELKEDIFEKIQRVENIQKQMEDVNSQLAHYKHEYNTSIANLKDAQADFRRCHEKESDIMDRLVKLRKQVEDTNNNLAAKIAEIVNLHKKIRKQEKVNRELNRELQRCDDVVKQTRDEVKTVRIENKSQKEALRENDVRFVKMKNQVDKILRERDLIANQMLRRTDENDILEREVTSLKLTVERGDGRYNERLEDIKMMKNEIKSLRSQCNVLKRGLQNTADMRHEVLILHRKLNQERSKGKVLTHEMLTPKNVHRWRKLKHGDPNRMDLLKKCQRAQRNVMMKSLKIAKGEEIIEALYKKIGILEVELGKKSTVEVQEKLMMTRSKMRMNEKRMKAAIAISRATIGDFSKKDETISKLQKDLNEVKLQFIKEKSFKSRLMDKFRKLKNEVESTESIEKEETLRKFRDGFKKRF